MYTVCELKESIRFYGVAAGQKSSLTDAGACLANPVQLGQGSVNSERFCLIRCGLMYWPQRMGTASLQVCQPCSADEQSALEQERVLYEAWSA